MSKRRVSAILVVAAMAVACVIGALTLLFMPIPMAQAAGPVDVADTSYKITSDTKYAIAPGVTERVLKTSTGAVSTEAFAMEVDVSHLTGAGADVAIAAGYGNRNPGTGKGQLGWQMSRLTQQAAVYEETHAGSKVVGGINASLFNISNGQPMGELMMDGVEYEKFAQDGDVWVPFLAITDKGKARIFQWITLENAQAKWKQEESDAGREDPGNIVQAIAGWFTLIENGNLTQNATEDKGSNTGLYPRSAVGIKEDGSIVLFQADGMQAPRSTGFSINEMAKFMRHLGCTQAMELDEGGSSTYISRREGEETFIQRNISAGGTEREISSTILVVSTAKASGEFARAVLTPNNEYYTPGASVELSAVAVDSAGQPIGTMPKDVAWTATAGELKGEAVGTFSETVIEGNIAYTTFEAADGIANQEITISLVEGAEETPYGTTVIGIYEPSEFSAEGGDFKFDSPVLNIGFGESSDLGLKAYYQSKQINMHAGDVTWTVKEIVEGVPTDDGDTAKYGQFEGIRFHVTENWRISGSIEVTATYRDKTESAQKVTVNIGLKPRIIFDGGDDDGRDYTNVDENGYLDKVENPTIKSFNYGHGVQQSLEILDKADTGDGALVRFGDHALKFNWDFSGWNNANTDGFCLGFNEDFVITDSPSAFGAWIYAPEGTPNFWLRGCIRVSEGKNPDGSEQWGGDTWLDFTQQWVKGALNGIDWVGWKYVSINLTQYAGKAIMIPAGMCLRFMTTTAGCGRFKQGSIDTEENKIPINSSYKGFILIDNYQFEYGSNTQDATNPVIDTFTYQDVKEGGGLAEAQELVDGTVLRSNYLCFFSTYSDTVEQNPYNVGIASSGGNYYIDGERIGGSDVQKDNMADFDEEGKQYIASAERKWHTYLSNGEHCVEIRVKDAFGNEAVRRAYITVAAPETKLASMRIEADATAPLGGSYSWKVYASDLANVGSGTKVELSVTSTFMQGEIKCELAKGFEAKALSEEEQTATKASGVFTLTIDKKDGEEPEAGEGLLATVTIQIPENTSSTSRLTWSAIGVMSLVKDPEEQNYKVPEDTDEGKHQVIQGFSTQPCTTPIYAELSVESRDQIVGLGDGDLYVRNSKGEAVEGATVYLVSDGKELGKTDAQGKLVYNEGVEKVFTDAQGKYAVYARLAPAEGEVQLSFHTDVVSYNPVKPEEGTEIDPDEDRVDENYAYFVIYNGVGDRAHKKNISWMAYLADPEGAALMGTSAQIKYSLKADMSGATVKTGESKIMDYTLTDNATIVNNVALDGLQAATTYYYQLGDGERWSPVASFTTGPEKINEANFYILGDMQGDIGIVEAMNGAMQKDGVDYSFGIQTGDIVDNPNNYDLWKQTLEQISEGIFMTTDFIHVIGNHEAEGDLTTGISRYMFGVPLGEEGDYYSYEYGPVYIAVLNYTLDAVRLQAFGKWLETDSAQTECAWKIVVAHVPAYGTNPAGGTDKIYRNNLEEHLVNAGIDFFFTGNDHSYARTKPLVNNGQVDAENGVVHFIVGTAGEKKYAVDTQDMPFEKADQNFNAIYMSVLATDVGITVNAWNVQADGSKTLYDSYTKGVKECDVAAHNFEYDSDSNSFHCTVCGHYYALDTHPEMLNYFNGLVTDMKTGNVRYFNNGRFYTGAVSIADQGVETWYYFDGNGLGFDGTKTVDGVELQFSKGKFVPTAEITDAGLAGPNVYFVLKANGELLLLGSGETAAYTDAAAQPWNENRTLVKKLFIGKNITALNNNALIRLGHVTEVVFEEGSKLERIEYWSLRALGENAGGVAMLNIPEGVKKIGTEALRDAKVKAVTLPVSLTTIAANAVQWFKGSCVFTVEEGSYAHTTLKDWVANGTNSYWKAEYSYRVCNHVLADTAGAEYTGITTWRNGEDAATQTVTYYQSGAEVSGAAEKYAVLKAMLLKYNALSADEKAAHGADYAVLKGEVAARNSGTAARNAEHKEATEAGTGLTGRKEDN